MTFRRLEIRSLY